MITKINNADDALQAFNENFEGILSGKRKLPVAKEINNNLGKMMGVIKMQLMHKVIVGDRTPLQWFGDVGPSQIQIESKPEKENRLKYASND